MMQMMSILSVPMPLLIYKSVLNLYRWMTTGKTRDTLIVQAAGLVAVLCAYMATINQKRPSKSRGIKHFAQLKTDSKLEFHKPKRTEIKNSFSGLLATLVYFHRNP